MAKRNTVRHREKYLFLLFTTLVSVGIDGQSDWVAEMEDAFATESEQSGMMCKPDPNNKRIFCRYQNDERIPLSTLSHCLCTHIVFSTELFHSVPTILRSLRSADTNVEILASISINMNNLENSPQSPQKLINWMIDQSFNGIDLRIENGDYLEDFAWSKFFKYLKDIRSLLNIQTTKSWILSVTISSNILSFLKDSQFLEISRYADYISSKPSTHSSEHENEDYFDIMQKVGVALKTGIALSKLLLPISLRNSIEQMMIRPYTNESYPELCKYLNNQTSEEAKLDSTSNTLPKNLFEILKNQVQIASQNEIAGVDIWSLNDDDGYNACGYKPFPLINEIAAELKGERKTFNSFTDLDIVLSTGESQLDEIQVLQEPDTDPEEIRKFKCERIGFYRHPSDCSKFYHCAEHRATSTQPSSQYAVFVYKCPSGLVFDELQGSCNWPSYSEPCQGSDELLPVASKKFQCVIPGFHVDPEDCRWFYYCSDLGDGRLAAFEFLCPSHLLGFDEQQLLCNWKWMVPTCANSPHTEREDEAEYAHAEPTIVPINNSGIDDNRNFRILDSVTPLSTTWNTFPDVENVNVPLALGLKLNHLNDSLKHRISVNSFLTEDEVKSENSSVNYTNSAKIIEKSNNNSKINGTSNYVKNNNEKKYGTAYWHRSMITNKSPDNHQRNRFDAFLERINNFGLNNNSSEPSKSINQGEEVKIDHKYGVGTVRKINLHPLQDSGEKDNLSENNQGRSLGDSISSSYHFENTLNDQDTTSHRKPFAQVKCSKLNNKIADSNEGSFGCISEVSLTVNIKEGKENNKFILKPDQLTSSVIEESEQVAVLPNHSTNVRNMKLQRLQIKISGKETLHDNNSDEASNRHLEKFQTQGRTASIERNIFELPQIHANTNTFQNEPGVSLSVNNPREHNKNPLSEKSFLERNKHSNTEHDNSKNAKTNNITLVRVPRTKHFKESVEEENNLMPLVFFPEGVLLNVDLNQINEIPPQILLEVDNMLKKYMSDGNIDLHLLMQKLNATAEPMSNNENHGEITSNDIDEMLGVIENLLNSTDNMQRMHNTTITNTTEGESFKTSKIENNTDQNDLQLQYENITSNIETSDKGRETEKIKNSTESSNTANVNDSNVQEIKRNPLSAEKILEVPENKPFVRRRLFRKHKFPSIREQLEFQNRSAYSRNLKNPSFSTTTTTVTSVHTPNHPRYPSIRQQLFLNNKRKNSLNARNNVIWKRLQEMSSETGIRDSTYNSNTSVQLPKSDNRNDIRLKDHELEYSDPPLKPHPSNDRDIYLKAEQLGNMDLHLKRHQLGGSDTQLKSHQFGDRLRPTDVNLSFNPNLQTPTLDLELSSHRNPIPENRRDSSFVSSERSNPRLSDEGIIVTMDFNSETASEKENTPSINNDIHSHRKPLQEGRFRYTLPLPPVYRTRNYPLPQTTTSTIDKNHLHQDTSESTVSEYPDIAIESPKQPRNSRKLRILVKKRFNRKQTDEGNSATEHGDASKIDHRQHMRMRIPKKLLNELKSNVLRKLALDGKSEVKLQIQFQDHVWNVPFVNDKSSVDISPVACTRPGLFQHPKDCNMFYECFWDKWLQRFTLHVFSCPVRLVYDDSIRGCSRPSFESHCRNSVDTS